MFTGERVTRENRDELNLSTSLATDDTRRRHHDNLNDLEDSAVQGCHVCVLVIGCLNQKEVEHLRPPSESTPERPLEHFRTMLETDKFPSYTDHSYHVYYLNFFFFYPRSLSIPYHKLPPAGSAVCIEKRLDLVPESAGGHQTP